MAANFSKRPILYALLGGAQHHLVFQRKIKTKMKPDLVSRSKRVLYVLHYVAIKDGSAK